MIAGPRALRDMALINCSIMLARLDKELQSASQNMFVNKGATGDFIHRTTRKEHKSFYPAATGKEPLKYLGWGSLPNSVQIQLRFSSDSDSLQIPAITTKI